MAILLICYGLLAAYVFQLVLQNRRFNRSRNSIPVRIHVNGIRGKSTVTRYVAALLRDAGHTTYGKTTGTAARVILPDGSDTAIQRRGYPNVNEQVGMIKRFAEHGAGAVVMECMAINPDYQQWLEEKVMHSSIVIITNVRLDHQEEMGYTLLDIARSLARSIPKNGILITAETNPRVLAVLRREAKAKGTRVVVARTSEVRKSHLRQFGHVAHAANVAIGLAVAHELGLDTGRAVAAMAAAGADPGAFSIQTFRVGGKTVRWANLFAVNDKESFAEITKGLSADYNDHHRIALLNNRLDRPSRVDMFSKLVQRSLGAATIVALGDYERQVQRVVNQKKSQLLLMGNTSSHAKSSGPELIKTALATAESKKVLLVGAVNIHTPQSVGILEYIARLTGETDHSSNVPVFRMGAERSGWRRHLRLGAAR